MKKYAVLFMTMISFTMSGADSDRKEIVSTVRHFTDRDAQKSSSIFWGLLNDYRYTDDREKVATLKAMMTMLENNPQILNQKGCINKRSRRQKPLYMFPLEWATLAASDPGPSAKLSLGFAQYVAQYDTNGHRRRSALKMALQRNSFWFAGCLLELGTTATAAPVVMKKAVEACKRFHGRAQRGTEKRAQLSAIINKLLAKNSDLSGLTNERLWEDCVTCQRIKHECYFWDCARLRPRYRSKKGHHPPHHLPLHAV